jgi:transcription-repair coupling factor (superfamily II helicase)
MLENAEDAGYFYHDLTQIQGAKDVLFFPSAYKRAVKYGQPDPANEILRMETLARLQQADCHFILVTYPEAVSEKVVAKDFFASRTLKLSVGEKVDSSFVAEVLDSYGFEYTDYVYEPGQYAIRGSILDVFSFSNEYPYRLDFFGDEIETIRTFEVESQLSKERLREIHIVPEMNGKNVVRNSLFELLPANTVVACRDYDWIEQQIRFTFEDKPILDNPEYDQEWQSKLITANDFINGTNKFTNLQFGTKAHGTPEAIIDWKTSLQPLFHKNFELVSKALHELADKQYQIYILSDSEKQIARIQGIFEDRGEQIKFLPVNKTLHEGFSDDVLKVCCFTDHQIFDRYHKYNLKSEKARSGKIALTIKELNQFQIGDFVVHIDHGVGKFGGLVRMEVNGKIQEMIKLFYLNNDAIFVSIHALHKISKYKGKEGEPPRINKLGSGAWESLKERTKKKVKDIARDLILLYSKRREERGYKFSPDTFLQHELEASFIYEDTPDQTKATQDVKLDMESDKPMDRLICGDVGFGKTEVAIRAAFKAVSDNKQVAVLVPTTVLATQHYHTFKDRLKDFPCRIDYLSRARKSSDVKKVLADVKERKIDVLIGTHRLVGKDVKFNDLGLLIIDEEQKFGVSTKEKLKQLRTNVDTLTMTATPIPRTLQFSLMGARDLSAITTPPPNRYPVQTELHTFDAEIIREAINFEMSRNGQVFVINNRIKNIYDIENLVRNKVPDARIAVGHGQMEPAKLEEVIEDFVNYEYDVLIATSIVESGIDISNANTIIVNDAQNFGLSDLHQLRGRVGRSNKKAFCYLLTPPMHTLTPEARRRLQAIENFSELGSGIHIAMQDLDIRGAGNMLGAEQSGFIADLGYETYQKILTEAVNELKNEEFADLYHEIEEGQEKVSGDDFVPETLIESDLELLFHPLYIPNDSERITLYRELDNMEAEMDIQAFVARLEDRFGKIPSEGRELIRVVRLKRMGKSLGMEKIILKNGRISIQLLSNTDSPYYQSQAFDKLLIFIQNNAKRCQLTEKNGKRTIQIKDVESVESACVVLEEILSIKL